MLIYLCSLLRGDASGQSEVGEAQDKCQRALVPRCLVWQQRCPRHHVPVTVLPVWGGDWGVCPQGCPLALTPSCPPKTNGSGKPSEFSSEALEIIQHCQKRGFADSQNPIGKPRWIYDLGWKPIWTIILHESDPSPEPGKTSWFWLIFHTRLLSTSVLISAEDETLGSQSWTTQNFQQMDTALFPVSSCLQL